MSGASHIAPAAHLDLPEASSRHGADTAEPARIGLNLRPLRLQQRPEHGRPCAETCGSAWHKWGEVEMLPRFETLIALRGQGRRSCVTFDPDSARQTSTLSGRSLVQQR